MGLLSVFKRSSANAAAAAETGDDVQRLRTRARRRLIGAAVLIVAGVVGFPLLFETHPRPIPVDIPIEIARKDQAAPLVMPPPRAKAAAAAVAPAASASSGVAQPAASAAAVAPVDAARAAASAQPAPIASAASAPAPKAEKASPPPAAATPPRVAAAPTHAAPAADAARARALLDGKSAPAKPAAKKEEGAAASSRFVVQVGAFADAGAARDMRQKVEKLGLKSYTQNVDTPEGRRIRVRVGPFATREEAEKAAGKVKTAGLPTAIAPL